jgi:BON domain-containing protein/PRC-barrel domain protein
MRVLTIGAWIAGVTLLTAIPGYPQTKPPETNKQPAVTRSPTGAKTAPKGIERIDSKEQLGYWQGSQIIGAKVEDPSGKNIGKIEDVMVDASGRLPFAVLSFGGFMGIGDKWYVVPWNAMQIERDLESKDVKRIVMDVSKETLARAPSFTKDRWPDTRDSQWSRDAQKFWSDTSITMAVKSKLASEKLSTLTKVNVDTHQGIVELKGTVDSNTTKERATKLARQVDGVRQVVNNLKVQAS